MDDSEERQAEAAREREAAVGERMCGMLAVRGIGMFCPECEHDFPLVFVAEHVATCEPLRTRAEREVDANG